VEAGADLELPTERGTTALTYAAQSGSLETVECLLAAGAELRPASSGRHSPLSAAAINPRGLGSVRIAARLLEALPRDAREQEHVEAILGRIAFHYKCAPFMEGLLTRWLRVTAPFDVDQLPAALQYGDATVADELGWAPVHWAAGPFGSIEWLDRLIAGGADINRRTNRGWTPLMNATLAGDRERVALLLESGADATATDEQRFTALHMAAIWGPVDIVELLLEAGASPWMRSRTGRSPKVEAGYNRRDDGDEIRRLIDEALEGSPLTSGRVELETDEEVLARLRRGMRVWSVTRLDSVGALEGGLSWSNPPVDGAWTATLVHEGGEIRIDRFCTPAGTVTGHRFHVLLPSSFVGSARLRLEPDRSLAAERGFTRIAGRALWFDVPPASEDG